MEKKEEEKKKPARRSPTLKKREKQKISQHEDIALKATAQFFRDEIMPALNIEGKVVSILPTESIHLELRHGFEDFNYLMEDGSIKHFEFQSTNEGVNGLRRFRLYEAQLGYQYGRPVTTYVLFSGKIRNPMTELSEGANTYRIHAIIMQEYDADEIIGALWRKVESGETLTKADLLPLVLTPLMNGKMSQKERITAAYGITGKTTGVDAEVLRKVEAVVYIMAEKFLETAEMEQLRREIAMTKLGQMIYDDGRQEGRQEGRLEGRQEGRLEGDRERLFTLIKKKLAKGLSVAEIADAVEESVETVKAMILELEAGN